MFGDVNLSEEQVRTIGGADQGPGAGGWPTIRYFNTATGYGGAPYPKELPGAMCDVLGKEDNMRAYIETQGWTSLCSVVDNSKCSDKQVDFIAKWKAKDASEIAPQLKRLSGMTKDAKSLKPDLAQWIGQRIAILTQLESAAAAPVKDEV
mmetsp:Transcript_71416/g.158794  ORF Transcript_71416/g.158794 Transcript_71416/m.158794 type:complete len:150 (-) Transcript_71416:423-872(-)